MQRCEQPEASLFSGFSLGPDQQFVEACCINGFDPE
jgi:hypothetical protein